MTDNDDFEKRLQKLENMVNGINEKIDQMETKRKEMKNKIETIEQEKIEQERRIEKDDKEKCTIEKLCKMTQEERKNNLDINTYRATLIWENFKEWSERIPQGKILKSSDIQKLLQTLTKDKKIKWEQTHRAMNEFQKKTPENYITITEDQSKAIIRKNL